MRIAACCFALQVTLLAAFPTHDGYVNDFASVLPDSDETYLEDYLRTLERDTSAEVAIATVTSLGGITIEEYANRLFAEWGIGKKHKDNGVLLLVAVRDRQVRIEVGYGLEPILPDGRAGEIIRTSIVPEFRAGNIPRGIGQGIDRIARIIRLGEPASPQETVVPQVVPDRSSIPVAVAVPFLSLFVAIAAFFAGTGISTRTVGPLAFAALFGGVPLALATAFLSLWWVAALLLFGGVVMAVGHRVGRSPYWLGILRTGKEGAREDDGSMPWIMGATANTTSDGSSDAGGDSSSVDSSSSSSSSSSDFGGGSSGGGGASGSW